MDMMHDHRARTFGSLGGRIILLGDGTEIDPHGGDDADMFDNEDEEDDLEHQVKRVEEVEDSEDEEGDRKQREAHRVQMRRSRVRLERRGRSGYE